MADSTLPPSIPSVPRFRFRDTASFWAASLDAADAGRRVVLGAWFGGELAGTVTLDLDTPPNQPHRADIKEMLVHRSARGRGVGMALMKAVEVLSHNH